MSIQSQQLHKSSAVQGLIRSPWAQTSVAVVAALVGLTCKAVLKKKGYETASDFASELTKIAVTGILVTGLIGFDKRRQRRRADQLLLLASAFSIRNAAEAWIPLSDDERPELGSPGYEKIEPGELERCLKDQECILFEQARLVSEAYNAIGLQEDGSVLPDRKFSKRFGEGGDAVEKYFLAGSRRRRLTALSRLADLELPQLFTSRDADWKFAEKVWKFKVSVNAAVSAAAAVDALVQSKVVAHGDVLRNPVLEQIRRHPDAALYLDLATDAGLTFAWVYRAAGQTWFDETTGDPIVPMFPSDVPLASGMNWISWPLGALRHEMRFVASSIAVLADMVHGMSEQLATALSAPQRE